MDPNRTSVWENLPSTWTMVDCPKPGTDATFGGKLAELSPDDLTAMTTAVETVTKALDKARARSSDRRILIFFGVGVGDPSDAWGQPTGGVELDVSTQINPALLADAVEQGCFVVGLNVNAKSTPAPKQIGCDGAGVGPGGGWGQLGRESVSRRPGTGTRPGPWWRRPGRRSRGARR